MSKGPYTGKLPSGVVKFGTRGDDAKRLQKFLNWSMGTSMKCSGIFGTKSTNLLKKWQKKHGILDDGIFGETSKAKAKNEIKQYASKSAIGEQANKMAYSTNTSKADYPDGKPTKAYKKGLNEAYPNRSKWGKAPRLGASCDVFVGTCVRCAGVDNKFPRGLSPSYIANSPKFTRVAKDDVRDGDIIVTPSHICIAYGGKVKEASHGDFYPKTTDTLKARLNASGAKVYRADTEKVLCSKLMEACKAQAKWAQNAIYKWVANPNLANSKKYETCVTYVAVVLQRIGYLKSGKYIWIDENGKVFGTTNRMKVSYLKGTLRSNRSKLKKGDIVIGGNGNIHAASGSHIFVLAGKWDDNGNPYIFDQASADRVRQGKKPQHTWTGDFPMIARIRLK